MLKYSFWLFLLTALSIGAVEHPISFKEGTDEPASFRTPGLKPDGIRCVTNSAGNYVYRVNARGSARKLISEERISVREGDILTLTLTLSAKTKGRMAAGFYLYHGNKGKYQPLPALFGKMEILPEKKVYTFRRAIPRQKNRSRGRKGVKAPLRANTAVIFFDVEKGLELDLEKIQYEVRKPAPPRKKTAKAKK